MLCTLVDLKKIKYHQILSNIVKLSKKIIKCSQILLVIQKERVPSKHNAQCDDAAVYDYILLLESSCPLVSSFVRNEISAASDIAKASYIVNVRCVCPLA